MDSLLNKLRPETPPAMLLEIDYVTEVVQYKWFDSYLKALDDCEIKYKIPNNGWCVYGEDLDEEPWGVSITLKYLVDETLTLWLFLPVVLKPSRRSCE